MKKYRGVTLIELLSALTIGTVIITSMTTIFLIAQKHYKIQTALHDTTEKYRLAEQLWMNIVRSISYRTCMKNTAISVTPYYHNDVKEGTDAITIASIDTEGDDLIHDMKDRDSLLTTTNHKFTVNDEIMISDCETAELFKIKNASHSSHQQRIISQTPLKKLYKHYAQINLHQHTSYFIGNTHRIDSQHNDIYALYSKKIGGKKMELLESINDMKIAVSILNDGILVDKSIIDIDKNNDIKGVAITLKHLSMIDNKTNLQNIYVAL